MCVWWILVLICYGECPQTVSRRCVFLDDDMFNGVCELWWVINIFHSDGQGKPGGTGAVSQIKDIPQISIVFHLLN